MSRASRRHLCDLTAEVQALRQQAAAMARSARVAAAEDDVLARHAEAGGVTGGCRLRGDAEVYPGSIPQMRRVAARGTQSGSIGATVASVPRDPQEFQRRVGRSVGRVRAESGAQGSGLGPSVCAIVRLIVFETMADSSGQQRVVERLRIQVVRPCVATDTGTQRNASA